VKLPRNLAGDALIQTLATLEYRVTRQTGSHVRLSTELQGQHHVTIPRHSQLSVGTLAAVLAEVAAHFGMSRDELLQRLFRE
jgi:predicted RNA binding protein YcfA (HicA-like mRNA interferase family)